MEMVAKIKMNAVARLMCMFHITIQLASSLAARLASRRSLRRSTSCRWALRQAGEQCCSRCEPTHWARLCTHVPGALLSTGSSSISSSSSS
ncbi:hypothetical protein ZWY2020_033802 [Hordeum vulgare]|nr:hypothetical protein ZWY2020_033802 [Hordeum vulgare]